jgi:hypothetical protein
LPRVDAHVGWRETLANGELARCGGTSDAGDAVTLAVLASARPPRQARRMTSAWRHLGVVTVVVCPDKHLGGLSSGGLGFTDTGNKAVIGGLSREFYHRVWQHYEQPTAWRWQARAEYGNRGQGTPAIDGEQRTMWIFEPHVAEQVFEDSSPSTRFPCAATSGSTDRERGVRKDGTASCRSRCSAARPTPASMFIDATYEGDLMAAAGVDYHVGREAKAAYGESYNGVQTGVLHHRHHLAC